MTAIVTLKSTKTVQTNPGDPNTLVSHPIGIGVAQVSSVLEGTPDQNNPAVTNVTVAGVVFAIGDTLANVVLALNR